MKCARFQDSPRRRSTGNMSYTDTLDADDEAFGDTIQDTLNLSDSAQLREDAKFHEMSRQVEIVVLDTVLLSQSFLDRHATPPFRKETKYCVMGF